MSSNAKFAGIAALAGDPTRAAMLHALMDGRALTATELARASGVTAQTASGHLAQLVTAGLLSVMKQGQHRYHRLASAEVAQMMEAIMQIASAQENQRMRVTTGPRDAQLRAGRTCYDHLAGRLGVALADTLVEKGFIELTSDAGAVTDEGLALFTDWGVDVESLKHGAGHRPASLMCRPCLDWSERRLHLAGRLGAALCRHSFDKGWIRRVEGTRAVTVSPAGERAFRTALGLRLDLA